MQLPVPHLKQAERARSAQSGDNTAVNVEGALQVLIQLPEQLSVPSPAEDRQPRRSWCKEGWRDHQMSYSRLQTKEEGAFKWKGDIWPKNEFAPFWWSSFEDQCWDALLSTSWVCKCVSVCVYVSHTVVLIALSCPTFCNPMDCSLPGSFVHGILQARKLEWVALPFSRGSSHSRDQTQVSHTVNRFFTI